MPRGLLYQEDFLSPQEERALLSEFETLTLEEAKYKAYTAKRRIAAFGSSYDFETHVLGPAPEIPAFLHPLRANVARLAEVREESFMHALRMRFRRYPPQKGARVFDLELAPRSVYVLRDEIRWGWQHSVARTQELRYSVTFRTSR